jgi:hypothetical protein
MTDQPTLPTPSLYWKVTDADGNIIQDGYALPVAAGAAAVQGKDEPAQDAPESDDDHGLD